MSDLDGWTPIRIAHDGRRPVVDWCHTAGVDFDDPFFDQTIERCLRHPFRLLFRRTTSLEALVERAAVAPGLAPSGFVLHMSRCGSTLITSMFAALASTLVLSEPGPLDTVLRGGGDPTVVRAVVAALGQPRRPGHRHLVVKVDAWTVLDLPVLLAAFPAVPWVFVHRDPVAVAVSQLRHRGWHAVPGALPPEQLGLTVADLTRLTEEEYVAVVLGRLCEAAAAHHPVAVDHRDLPAAAVDVVARHFGVPVDDDGRAAALAVAARDAKNPVIPYEDDGADKQRAATPAVLAAVDRYTRPAYEALLAAATPSTWTSTGDRG